MTHISIGVMFADIGGLLLLPVGLMAIAFWIWMIVDCAKYEASDTAKIAWLLLILFAGVIAAPVYFLFRHVPRRRSARYRITAEVYQPWQKDAPLSKSRR